MAELTPDIAPDVVAACQAATTEVAAALAAALDGEFAVTVGEPTAFDLEQPPDGFNGPGLAILLQSGESGAVAVLPESSRMLPDWLAQPDDAGGEKLAGLAESLGKLLLPESVTVGSIRGGRVGDVTAALAPGEVAPDAKLIPLNLQRGDQQAQLSLIWPLTTLAALLPVAVADSAVVVDSASAESDEDLVDDGEKDFDLSQLPDYVKGLLHIAVPVTVTLATQRKPIQEILEIVPGSIIKFDKTCDELLDLNVGDRTLATGDVVKVGDKFGLRITALTSEGERRASA